MKVAALAIALATSALPALASAVNMRSEGVLPALLRGGSAQRRSIVARQAGTCDVGYLACSDGDGCCPVGEYCGTWGGKPGCCPNGETCVANDNPCIYVGDVLCPGETFCCPAGDTCYRDATGAPKCSTTGGGNTVINTNTKVNTNTIINTNTLVNTPSATFIGGTTTNTPLTSAASGPAATTSKSGGGITNPFSSGDGNGAAANGVSGVLLVAVGVAANILLAAH